MNKIIIYFYFGFYGQFFFFCYEIDKIQEKMHETDDFRKQKSQQNPEI